MGSLCFASTAMRHVSASWCPDLPGHRPTRLHQYNHSLAELPSCVTPSLGYYQAGSRAPPTTLPKEQQVGIGRLAHLDSPGTRLHEHGNINPLSIDYACRPRLRSRLTLGGKTWPRNPWSSGGRVSHSAIATHACILTHAGSTAGSLRRFTTRMTLPYPTPPPHRSECPWCCRGFGGALEPRYIVGAGPLDQ
jgi:hypothetical protein